MAAERVGGAARQRLPARSGKQKATISIIGAGRMGTALALALVSHGYRIEAVVARRKSHALASARLIATQPLALASAQLDALPASDILLITTPDDAIESTALRLAAIWKSRARKMKGTGAKGVGKPTALHASGALSSASLRSLGEQGLATGSLHPLISVSDSLQGAKSLPSAFFCIEGDSQAQRVARSLVSALGAKDFSIRTKDKALYHAAAVMASGHVTALFDIAVAMLASCGLTRSRARAVLLPLLASTLENLRTAEPAHALTGTFARADAATVSRHLVALRQSGEQDALAAYALLGLRSLQLALRAGASPGGLKEIAALLAEAKM
jgi:predicted short-subunit dehydrogenase-like oxidoreductase (DUF2520 family)